MSTSFKQFKDLHQSFFVLPNIWDAKSALVLQEKKFPAVATSSMAAASSLGYEDGEKMSFEEYLFVIKRIAASVHIPLSVDIEMGYGESDDKILSNITRLIELGVAGINIEDSTVDASGRTLKEARLFARTIEYIKNKLAAKNFQLFINARCDTYILNVDNKHEETKNRLTIYEKAGADGIFLPCISGEDDIAEAVGHTKLPVNVMCIPGLPNFDRLDKLGVKRVSMGPFLFNKVYDTAGQLADRITSAQNFSPVLS